MITPRLRTAIGLPSSLYGEAIMFLRFWLIFGNFSEVNGSWMAAAIQFFFEKSKKQSQTKGKNLYKELQGENAVCQNGL